MQNISVIPFAEDDFPITVVPNRTSLIDSVESAKSAIHEALEIKYFYEGTSTLLIGSESVVAKAGDIIVISPYEFHATVDYGATKGKYHLLMIGLDFFEKAHMDGPDLRQILLGEHFSFQRKIRGNERMQNIIAQIVEEYVRKENAYKLAIRGLLLELFVLLLRTGNSNGTGLFPREEAIRYYKMIEPALRRIRDDYGKCLTVEELAELCCISKYYFCRVFKEVTGRTVMQYLNDYRFKIADTMLQNTDKSIADIAELCGFSGENYFCRYFKKHFGISPGRRRRMEKEK